METKFNFKSQVATSREQSERLLALGLKKETADCHWFYSDEKWKMGEGCNSIACENLYPKHYIPAWSLHRLIKMMPESIHLDSFANTHYNRTLLPSKIIYMKYDHTWIWQSDKQNDFDKCVDTIEWLIKQGYFPKEYLV
jgi:hypothetical protein